MRVTVLKSESVMTQKIGFLMDPIEGIKIEKDTTFALMLETQRRNNTICYFTMKDVWLQDGVSFANMKVIRVDDNKHKWFEVLENVTMPLHDLDLLLMRKDPPFNMDYVQMTYLLEIAESKGLRILNKPQSLRDANEKLYTAWFPHCCPPTFVSNDPIKLKKFIGRQGEAIVKPLDQMGGDSIYRVNENTENLDTILDKLTSSGKHLIMSQRYIPEITDGDKRIILINGEHLGYALARIPAEGSFLGNLAAGAKGIARELTDRDKWICQQVGPTLKQKGLYFVGLDVIGDYLTEINVTSPTGVREIEVQTDINICQLFFDKLFT